MELSWPSEDVCKLSGLQEESEDSVMGFFCFSFFYKVFVHVYLWWDMGKSVSTRNSNRRSRMKRSYPDIHGSAISTITTLENKCRSCGHETWYKIVRCDFCGELQT